MSDNTPLYLIAGLMICLVMFSCDMVDATKKQTEVLQEVLRKLDASK